jgi:uncharacterized protein
MSAGHERVMAAAERLKASGETEPRWARDPVNQPQVHTWLEAIGDPNPVYRDTDEARELHGGPVAPPAMAQVWTMYGLDPHRPAGDPLHAMMGVLDDEGFTSVLGTNCDQTYDRYLRPGDHVSVTTRLESVVGPKRTAVGEGYFVTTRSVWRVTDDQGRHEQVASMLFRVLKYSPCNAGLRTVNKADDATRRPSAERSSAGLADPRRTVRPMVNRDTAYFWEGTRAGELRIQTCNACGLRRHPPGPLCPSCGAADRAYVVSPGLGSVHSYVVHHAPPIPGKTLPLVLAVVELDEGVRMVGELREVEPSAVAIGQRVQVSFERIDEELSLPVWVSAGSTDQGVSPGSSDQQVSTSSLRRGSGRATDETLPPWELPVTTTLVVSTALATRDYQDVHHDPDRAVERGSKDIFLNILTTTGLVQRYVGQWAGAGARIHSCELRLGAPAHPGATLTFTGTATPDRDHTQRWTVDVTGTVPAGSHVTARVTLTRDRATP